MTKYTNMLLLLCMSCILITNALGREESQPPQTDKDNIENYGVDRPQLYKEIEERLKTKTHTYVIDGKPIYVEQKGYEIVTSNKQSYLIVLDEDASLKKTKEYEKFINEFDSSINVIVIKPSHWFALKVKDDKNNCYLITKDGIDKFQANSIQKIIEYLKKKRDQKAKFSVLKFLVNNLTTVVLVVLTVVLLSLTWFVSRK